jgi:hypothetical protein
MMVYLLYEISTNDPDEGCVMSVWSTRKGAEKEAKRLEWRACLGYRVVEMEVKT